MLTATYTLVAVSNEQKNARIILSQLRLYIDECMKRIHELDLTKIEAILNHLNQFDQYCRARKFELYLIPSIRGTAVEIDHLVGELESISTRAMETLKEVRERLLHSLEANIETCGELCHAMKVYCDNLLGRLTKEEELLPLLGRMLSNEQWFPIATQFLSEDKRKHKPDPVRVPSRVGIVNAYAYQS